MAKNQTEQEIRQQNVAEAVSKTEEFLNEHKNLIYWSVLCILVITLGVLAYVKFYLQPRRVEAQAEMFHAEQWFQSEDYALALEGDDNYLGFADIASKYGKAAGESVYLYAGICSLRTGAPEEALKYLRKYSGKDKILLARAEALKGDCCVELEDYSAALGHFEKAAKISSNAFSAAYLLKAGVTAEKLGDNAKALAIYKEIKDQYSETFEAMEIDKYIARIEIAE